jgi:hypothetical protein
LIHYPAGGGQVEFRPGIPEPILFVDGSLSGPEHDPFRYVRALVSVGWRLTNSLSSLRAEVDGDL